MLNKALPLNQRVLSSRISLTLLSLPYCFITAPSFSLSYSEIRTQLQGSFVTQSNHFMGDIDSLLPLNENTNHFLFANIQGRYANDNTWLISPGGGIRKTHNNQLFGLYAFTDYQQTNPKAEFWVINPGLEWMSPALDLHFNGYFPTQNPKKRSPTVFASTLGNYNYVHFDNHIEWDELFAPMVTIGRGIDIEGGYSFDLQGYRGRIYAGAYTYQSQLTDTHDIKGGLAGIQLPLNRYADVLVTDSYNNLSYNSIALTLRASWGAERSYSKDINDRLLDRIERHNGIIQTGAANIAQMRLADTGYQAISNSNIWFFIPNPLNSLSIKTASLSKMTSSTITQNSCTYEHPCDNFGQSSIDKINSISPNALFYLKPGNYPLSQEVPLSVHQGQTFSGRTANYTKPAVGTNRAFWNGAILAQGNTSFNNIRVHTMSKSLRVSQPNFIDGSATFIVPKEIGMQNVELNNVELTIKPVGFSNISALIAAGGNIHINHSVLDSYSQYDTQAYSLIALNNSIIRGTNNTFSARSDYGSAYTIASFNQSRAILNHSYINTHQTNGTLNISPTEAIGLYATDTSNVIFNFNHIDVKSKSEVTSSILGAGSSQITLNNNFIQSQTTQGLGETHGVYLKDNSTAILTASQLKSHSLTGKSFGAKLLNFSKLTVNGNSYLSSLANIGESVGIYQDNNSILSSSYSTILSEARANSAQGVLVLGASKVIINNTSIQAKATSGNAGGIDSGENSSTNVSNSAIIAQSNKNTFGVAGAKKAQLTFNNNLIEAQTTQGTGETYGVYLKDNSTATLSTSHIKASSSAGNTYGVFLFDASKLTLKHSVINSLTMSSNKYYSSEAYGLFFRKDSILTASESAIFTENMGFNATGVFTISSYNNHHLDHLTIQTISNKGDAIGINANAGLIISNNTIKSISNGSSAIGIQSEEDNIQLSNSVIESQITSGLGTAKGIDLPGWSSNFTMKDSQVKVRSAGGLSIGASLKNDESGRNASKLSIERSTIDSLAINNGKAIGVELNWFTTLTATNSNIITQAQSTNTAQGIVATEFSKVDLINNKVQTSANKGTAIGISGRGQSNLTLTSNIINTQSKSLFSYGIKGQEQSNMDLKNNMIKSQITSGAGTAVGASSSGTSNLYIATNILTMESALGKAIGLENLGNTSNIFITESTLKLTAPNSYIEGGNSANIHFVGSNTCTINGQTISCP